MTGSAALICGLAGWCAAKAARRLLRSRRSRRAAGATCDCAGITKEEGLAKQRGLVYKIEATAASSHAALPQSLPAGAAAPTDSKAEEAAPSDPVPAAPHKPVPSSQAGACTGTSSPVTTAAASGPVVTEAPSGLATREAASSPVTTEAASSPVVAEPASSAIIAEAASGSPLKLRYGAAAGQGPRPTMEDAHVILPSFADGGSSSSTRPGAAAVPCRPQHAFFGVFDGHNGSAAAEFARDHLAQALLASEHFPHDLPAAMRHAFLHTDEAFYRAVAAGGEKNPIGGQNPSGSHEPYDDDGAAAAAASDDSGATALAAVLWGGRLVVGNAGDCRAVLSRRGKALELSSDHKPGCAAERQRIEAAGGFVCAEGRLGGELSVARAIGDYGVRAAGGNGGDGPGDGPEAASWLKRPSDEPGRFRFVGPLTAEPEVMEHALASEDEFVVLACDGLWDVLGSQRAVELGRAHLRAHNDPGRTAQHLVDTALSAMHSSDNVTCLVVCFSGEAPPPRFRSTRPRSSFSALQQPAPPPPPSAPPPPSSPPSGASPPSAPSASETGPAAAGPLGGPAAPSGQASPGAPLFPQRAQPTPPAVPSGGLGVVAE